MPDPEIAEVMTEPAEVSPPRRRRALVPLLVIACLLLVGMLAFRVFSPKPVLPPKIIAYSPQQAAEAKQHLDDLGAQLAEPALDTTAPASAPQPSAPGPRTQQTAAPVQTLTPKPPSIVRLQLSQADLNTYLATDKKIKPLLTARGIQAVQVSLLPPHNVVFRAAVLYRGRKTNIQIAGALLPSPDTLARLDATQAQVGSLPLPPKTVTAQADRIASQFIGHLRGRLPITVQTIEVVGDHLILTGIRHPRAPTHPVGDSRQSASPVRH
jgi:hypothetical protein